MFARNPALLLDSSISYLFLVQGVITAFIGVACLATAVEGQMKVKLKVYQRALLLVASLLMVYTGTLTDIIGLVLVCIVVVTLIIKNKSEKVAE